jgi:hypothetical protein
MDARLVSTLVGVLGIQSVMVWGFLSVEELVPE